MTVDDGFRLKAEVLGYVSPRLGQPVHLIDVPDDDTIARVLGFVVDVGCWNVGIRYILSILLINPEFDHGWVCDGEG